MKSFLGVTFSNGEFTIDEPLFGEFLSPAEQIKNDKLKLLHQICADFDDQQEDRLP